jgi:lanosterol synthase
MILSQYVIVQRILGRIVDYDARASMVRHFEATRTETGTWALHPESPGYVFTTTLAYIALRLLGLGPDHPLTEPARRWLHAQPGGVLSIPSWGKFWLALIGLYDYEGVNPCPPELFLLPRGLPIHPSRYYCHTRYIYLAMAYLWGRRFRAELGPIGRELRQELFGLRYEEIDFAAHRKDVAATDLHARPARILRLASSFLAAYERRPVPALRQRALDHCLARIRYEQRTSRYQSLSPVNGLLNCLALWSHDPEDPDVTRTLEGLESWKREDAALGRRYAGARSHTWDTAFAMQALLANPQAARRAALPLRRAYAYLRAVQQTEELPDYRRELRDPALGGWCFSDGQHRWPVSDCTAEALTAILTMHDVLGSQLASGERMAEERLLQAVNFILKRQNDDGGFGTYERRRGPRWLEALNPSEMYGNCMVEGSYLECTGSALCALAHFRRAYPGRDREDIDRAIERGRRFLCRSQRADGSFAGAWGIHFTYGAFHVVKGLRAAGMPANHAVLARCADWLRRKQKPDGGWGEHYTGCLQDCYVEHPQSQVTMTSWALLALLDLLEAGSEPIRRGIEWLQARQKPDGSWPDGAVNGVFFGTAMLDYRLYTSYFPTWALGRHACLTAVEVETSTPALDESLPTVAALHPGLWQGRSPDPEDHTATDDPRGWSDGAVT